MLRASHSRRDGLTLMELVVVVAILVALASILVPLIPGLIGRAETSGRATNSQEIYKAIQLHQGTLTRYPNDWDALTDGSTTPLTYVQGFTGTAPPLTIAALTGPQTNALRASGITRLQLMATTPGSTTTPAGDMTFNPYMDVVDRASATGALTLAANGTPNLAVLTPAGQAQLNLSDNATTSTGTYVVFGFGKRASIVGTGVNEAPVNFFDNASLSPNTRYSRYGVVFQVSGIAPNATNTTIIDYSRARLVRVIRFGNTLGTGDDALNSYWQDVATAGGS